MDAAELLLLVPEAGRTRPLVPLESLVALVAIGAREGAAPVVSAAMGAVGSEISLPPSHTWDRENYKRKRKNWTYGGHRPNYTASRKMIERTNRFTGPFFFGIERGIQLRDNGSVTICP